MKQKIRIRPCQKGGKPEKGFVLCFVARPARKKAKRHVTEYHTISGEKIGFLGPRCTASWTRKGASSFPGKKAAEFAVNACELYVQNPGGKNPEIIYKKAEKMEP